MKKPLALLSNLALTLGIAPSFAEATSFKDVPSSYRFYEDSVLILFKEEIMEDVEQFYTLHIY